MRKCIHPNKYIDNVAIHNIGINEALQLDINLNLTT